MNTSQLNDELFLFVPSNSFLDLILKKKKKEETIKLREREMHFSINHFYGTLITSCQFGDLHTNRQPLCYSVQGGKDNNLQLLGSQFPACASYS